MDRFGTKNACIMLLILLVLYLYLKVPSTSIIICNKTYTPWGSSSKTGGAIRSEDMDSLSLEEWCKTHEVAPNGAFCHQENYVGIDTVMAPQIVTVIKDSGGKTVGDFGAGPGLYSKFFNASGLVSKAYDGSIITPRYVTKFDISKPLLSLPVFDWVVCLEVGEHVAEEFQYIVLDNIANHSSMGAVLSWAVPGQSGTAHVNNKSNEWVIAQMLARHFVYNETASLNMRMKPKFKWFEGTAMVFHRKVAMREIPESVDVENYVKSTQ